MHVIESEHLATEQTGTELCKVLFHAVNSDAICKVSHAKGLSHLNVGHGMLFVKQRKERTEKDKTATGIKHLMCVGYQLGGNGKLLLVGKERLLRRCGKVVWVAVGDI